MNISKYSHRVTMCVKPCFTFSMTFRTNNFTLLSKVILHICKRNVMKNETIKCTNTHSIKINTNLILQMVLF